MDFEKNFKYYKKIIELMPGHVYWKDLNGVFLGCNLQQAIDAGFSNTDEFIGKTDADTPWANQADYLSEIDQRVISSGENVFIEEISRSNDGVEKMYLSNKIPLKDEDGVVCGIIGISFDISERKKYEEATLKAKELAESANILKTEFIQNMQHDIQTPAAGIGLAIRALLEKEMSQEAKHILTLLGELSDQLSALCRSYGGQSSQEIDGQIITLKEFDIRELVSGVLSLNRIIALNKGLDLKLHVQENFPVKIIADEFRVRRILVNLLSNAVKFTDQGSVSVTLSSDLQAGNVHIEIRDTGIGIESEKLGSIFDKFTRALSSQQQQYPGTGLGLYAVKVMVDELKADLQVSSVLGQGSCFSVTIPYEMP